MKSYKDILNEIATASSPEMAVEKLEEARTLNVLKASKPQVFLVNDQEYFDLVAKRSMERLFYATIPGDTSLFYFEDGSFDNAIIAVIRRSSQSDGKITSGGDPVRLMAIQYYTGRDPETATQIIDTSELKRVEMSSMLGYVDIRSLQGLYMNDSHSDWFDRVFEMKIHNTAFTSMTEPVAIIKDVLAQLGWRHLEDSPKVSVFHTDNAEYLIVPDLRFRHKDHTAMVKVSLHAGYLQKEIVATRTAAYGLGYHGPNLNIEFRLSNYSNCQHYMSPTMFNLVATTLNGLFQERARYAIEAAEAIAERKKQQEKEPPVVVYNQMPELEPKKQRWWSELFDIFKYKR